MPTLSRTAAALTILCSALSMVAQQPALTAHPPKQNAPSTVTREITIAVDATTSKGDPVRGLTAADFHLLDNKAPRAITAVKEVTPAQEPVSLFLVVDTVNIDYTRLAYVRSEIDKFLLSNGGKLAHPATFVIVTDKGGQMQQGFSFDGNALSEALKQYPFGLREIRRSAGVWGADERMQISISALQNLVTHAATLPGRKLVLWISPGWPLLSGPNITLSNKQQGEIFHQIVAMSTQMRAANVTLDNINPLGPGENLVASNYYEDFLKGIKKPSDTQFADLSLQVLSVQSGGRTFLNNSDVAGNLARSAVDGNSWYELTFDSASAERSDEYHRIQIEAAKSTTVRTRDGYYAQP